MIIEHQNDPSQARPGYPVYGTQSTVAIVTTKSDMDQATTVNQTAGAACTQAAIDDFPSDLFTEQQRENGAVLIHILTSLYLFAALAVVCDKYFVPAVDMMCKALNMSNDVAGATFMAAATSAPELFVNVIGTFITEGDIGVGTIVGSAVFNILAVAACCGIGAVVVVTLDWWPLTRDCFAYGITVAILICIIHDERVEWYEALVLVLLYLVYIMVMYFDKKIQIWARETLEQQQPFDVSEHQQHNGNIKWSANETNIIPKISSFKIINPDDAQSEKPEKDDPKDEDVHFNENTIDMKQQPPIQETGEDNNNENVSTEYQHKLMEWPTGRGWFIQVRWIVTWPIYLIFLFTIPDCEKPRYKNWFALTFIMCIVWIGSLSYVVAWMITILGHTLKIPDSVMGITFLAAGTSVPEAVSSVIVAKKGHGSMGISNSIGSNTFDILLCLGLPWLIKASFLPTEPGHHWVAINSSGLEYSAISLLSTLFMLYIAFYFNKFKLDKRVGLACLIMYVGFLVLATLIELNVFFTVNLPTCGQE